MLMRRVSLILGIILITGLIIHEIYEFIIINDGISYFSSEPKRIAYAVLLGVIGGIISLGTSRLLPGSHRYLKLFSLGGFGLVLLCSATFAGYLCSSAQMTTVFYEGLASGWVLVSLIVGAAAACLVALEFTRVWRQAN